MFVISCAGVYCDASMWFSSWQLICLVYMHEKHIWTLVILPSPIIPGGETDSICRRQHHMTVELDTRFVRPRWVVISKRLECSLCYRSCHCCLTLQPSLWSLRLWNRNIGRKAANQKHSLPVNHLWRSVCWHLICTLGAGFRKEGVYFLSFLFILILYCCCFSRECKGFLDHV